MIKKLGIPLRVVLFILSMTAILLILGIPMTTYAYFARDLGSKERIMNRNESGLILLDREGEPFFVFGQAKTRDDVELSDIPEHTINALIAMEDRGFYNHEGFSTRGIIRAFWVNLNAGEIKQGGSTISQGLVKNQLLSPEKSFIRKYQEVVLANELEKRFTKNEILEMYLNSAYFGEGAVGIEGAAQTYFSKSTKDLTLGESALLIGLLPAPSVYSPLSNDPNIAKERQKLVLGQMVTAGYITKEAAEDAAIQKLVVNPIDDGLNQIAPHFALMIKDILSQEYGEEYVVRSGMQVKTTLNRDWQEYAQEAAKRRVEELKSQNASNAAVVVIDPDTGEILVMVGSYDWNDERYGKVNMATSPRQSGSSFKPIIYSVAIDEKIITPATILRDEPREFQRNYRPRNYDNRFRGSVTVRRALANSLNVPAVEVMDKLGLVKAANSAKEFGFSTIGEPSEYGLSFVLGSAGIRLDELVSAYSVFANGGVRADPIVILEIRDKYGKVISKKRETDTRVISEGAAYLISSILSDKNARAEVFGNLLNINVNAAVKTGTTQDYRDALTIGYTPNLVVGVWVGNSDNTPMSRVAGSLGAAPLWKDLMGHYLDSISEIEFDMPSTVEKVSLCRISYNDQRQPVSANRYEEVVLEGTLSNQSCPQISPSPENPEGQDQDGEQNRDGNEGEGNGNEGNQGQGNGNDDFGRGGRGNDEKEND